MLYLIIGDFEDVGVEMGGLEEGGYGGEETEEMIGPPGCEEEEEELGYAVDTFYEKGETRLSLK